MYFGACSFAMPRGQRYRHLRRQINILSKFYCELGFISCVLLQLWNVMPQPEKSCLVQSLLNKMEEFNAKHKQHFHQAEKLICLLSLAALWILWCLCRDITWCGSHHSSLMIREAGREKGILGFRFLRLRLFIIFCQTYKKQTKILQKVENKLQILLHPT